MAFGKNALDAGWLVVGPRITDPLTRPPLPGVLMTEFVTEKRALRVIAFDRPNSEGLSS